MANYGTIEYYEEELKEAQLKYKLYSEAISMRLKDSFLDTVNLEQYLKILVDAKATIKYLERELKEKREIARKEAEKQD
jgi:hypothetical protein